MQKLSKVNLLGGDAGPLGLVVPVIGMAALWMSLFKQLLYPALYAYYRTGDESAIAAQGAYAAAFVIALLGLMFACARIGDLAGARRWAVVVAVFGAAGAAGIALRAFGTAAIALYIGSALSAVYVPVHFAFWVRYAWKSGGIDVAKALGASFALFAAAFCVLTFAQANTVWVSVACPVVSAAMAIVCPQLEDGGAREAANVAEAPGAPEAPEAAPAHELAPALEPASGPEPAAEPALAVSGLPSGFAETFDLSGRETELAAYAHRNWSARRIAGELFIAESTVYTHLKRIYRKTGVHSKHELIELIDSWR